MTANILVVDDNPDIEPLILQKFRGRIREGNVEFIFVRDAIEALKCLHTNGAVDLIINDINMPRMDGLFAAAKPT
jgi:adenylate cyclase